MFKTLNGLYRRKILGKTWEERSKGENDVIIFKLRIIKTILSNLINLFYLSLIQYIPMVATPPPFPPMFSPGFK